MQRLLLHRRNAVILDNEKKSQLSPMMQHYMIMKDQYKDCILFYRLGDFYEMFFDDALTASRELEITLTGRDCGLDERAPMCGVPYHAVDSYLTRLVNKGYKVAICEQMEDPRTAKGMVKREVTRVVTPGTNINDPSMDETRNSYLMCLYEHKDAFGISVTDISTGEFLMTEVDSLRKAMDEVVRFSPLEVICNRECAQNSDELADLKDRLNISLFEQEDGRFSREEGLKLLLEHFQAGSPEALGISDYPLGMIAAGALLSYLTETQKNTLSNLTHLQVYSIGRSMILDSSTRRNLELCETLREKNKKGSLLWVLDKTRTAMGARMLRHFVEQPLVDADAIEERLLAVEELKENAITREELREYLNPVYDLERLIGRITYQSANPRDMLAFRTSLEMLPSIRLMAGYLSSPLMKKMFEQIDPLTDVCELLQASIIDEPPITIREGGIIKEGFNEEVDRLRRASTEGKSWLAKLEADEREKTGIKNLRIKYNKVFGYYLEVTNSFKNLVPDYYMRKQTLTNAERYITPELKELEDTILGAEDRLLTLEYGLYVEIRSKVAAEIERILQTASAVATLDAIASLAQVADNNNYVKPSINERGIIEIKNGRHPVVEQMLRNDQFIPNDTLLDNKDNRLSIITGPNMAGKSTYMRQVALIVLMAQMGSFVPADSAKIGLVDRIFTRVGASDDLASGQSTFMIEMTEVANILRNATKNSLLILDEIGRGTSTYDGLSIAWAVVEHIANPRLLGAKTLFATHYHELTELEGKLPGVSNYCIAVKEQGENILFLRKIIPGGADKSYGIQVARLAGVPQSVIARAKQLAMELADSDITITVEDRRKKKKSTPTAADLPPVQTEADNASGNIAENNTVNMKEQAIITKLRNIDVTRFTPIEALNLIYELQGELEV